ncbi:MAG: lipocalin family protein [Granulosicoccus sp.]
MTAEASFQLSHKVNHLRHGQLLLRCTLISLLVLASACTGLPKGVQPVGNFELDRYLGTWYEIARLDHRFERDLQSVTAEYSLQSDGSVKVVNSGVSAVTGEKKQAEGKAKFVSEPNLGHLKVSFFGPFYASYVVFELDREAYDYAFVSGNNKKYLWLLARTPNPSAAVIERFKSRAAELGFALDELILVDHRDN